MNFNSKDRSLYKTENLNNFRIILDPLVNVYYAGFYIEALMQKFGKHNICFSSKPFVNLPSRDVNFNFIIVDNRQEKKISIHFDDFHNIKKENYKWCDVYGNVNTNIKETPEEFHSKLVSLAPSFGIRLWNFPQCVFYALTNLSYANSYISYKKFLGKYRRMYSLRIPYKDYCTPHHIEDNYIFHLSTLWYNDEWNQNDATVNLSRANFIRACKSIKGLNFEGGLVSQSPSRSSEDIFNDCLYNKTLSMKSWTEKTKKSLVVFNTPAFWKCHGWKLGEYLALGKAIISTPLSNDLPAPLIHGENIHYVQDDKDAILEAIIFIVNNPSYRKKLENGAKNYWQKYGSPLKSLELLGL